jgi:ATP-dependent Clp protease adaptor protein ClpS
MSSNDQQSADASQTASRPEQPEQLEPVSPGGAAAVQTRPAPAQPRLDRMPPYRVLLHNDDHSDMMYVVDTLCDLTPLTELPATAVMMEAHKTGVALVLVTHQERAELYVEQFRTKRLTVTIEPAE